jgi:hypothetical protein
MAIPPEFTPSIICAAFALVLSARLLDRLPNFEFCQGGAILAKA